MMRSFTAAMTLLAFCMPALGQENTQTFIYTKTKQADLEMVVHFPPGWDMADPKSDDPVLRQSTRLTCMFVFEGQTSYDPRFIRKLFPDKDIYKIVALQKLFDFNPNQLDNLPAEKYKLFEECSPITHVTKEAPPVLLIYNNPIDAEITNQGIGIHHPLFGKVLKDKMDALKIPCEVVAAGKRLAGDTPTRPIDFLREHFAMKK